MSDPDRSEDLCICAKLHVVTKHRHRSGIAPIADRYSLAQGAVASDLHILVNENISKMVNPQARPDLDALGDADAGQRFGEPKREPVKTVGKPANQSSA